MKPITIHTDGGCSPNPGPGGWGAVIQHVDGHSEELSGASEQTTNNQMELTAAIEALKALAKPSRVEIVTDSTYLKKGITTWIKSWRKRDWLTKNREPVKNQELWQALDREIARHVVTWKWVKGHSGDPGNERADALASAALPGPDLPLDDQEAAHLFCCVSFSGKSKTGGFGVVLRHRDRRKEVSGRVEQASANQMHLHAAVAALSALRRRMKVHLYTTSSYARDGATHWIPGWRRRGWETAAGKSVQHRNLWEEIDRLNQRHDVSWHLVDRGKGAPEEVLAAKRLSGQALELPDGDSPQPGAGRSASEEP